MRSGFIASWMLVVLAAIMTVSPASGQARPGFNEMVMPKQNRPDRLDANPANVNQAADSVTNLAQKIAGAIARPNSKTEIFSPVSIAAALSLLLLGSSGRTQEELLAMMCFGGSQLSLHEIHYAFGRLFQDLVANDPTLVPAVSWRVNNKCNRYDEDYEDDEFPPANTTTVTRDLDIQVGNGMFAKEELIFDKRYKKLAKELYHSELQQLDFEGNEAGAVRTINNWINNVTHGRIADIVSHISPETIMMIVNTLYFKGIWEEPFQPMATRNRPFFPNGPDAGSIDVPMMGKGGCMPYYFWAEEKIRVLGIPYKQNTTMYILMPMNSTRELVQAMQSKIDAATLNDLITKMKMKSVTLLMPKMHVTNSLSLKGVLEQLGAASLFQRDSACISGSLSSWLVDNKEYPVKEILELLKGTTENTKHRLMERIPNCTLYSKVGVGRLACQVTNECEWGAGTCFCCLKTYDDDEFHRYRRRVPNWMMQEERKMYVNEMLHKVDLKVNEVGTEGGPATATLIDRSPSQVIFIVNGPFLMLVRDDITRLPLIYGAVYNLK